MLSHWLTLPVRAAYAFMRTLFESDLRDHLGRVTIPTALFHGRHDTICDAGWVEYMAARIPGARVVWFEHGAHCLMVEEPVRFAHELTEFVDTTRLNRGPTP